MNEEKEKGNIVIRSAGSHSCVDVVSIDMVARVIKLIQCKQNDFSELDKNRLLLDMCQLNNIYRCEFVII